MQEKSEFFENYSHFFPSNQKNMRFFYFILKIPFSNRKKFDIIIMIMKSKI